ncbi:MAG: DUF177 domain-containing protein [Pseudomonadota bacterium]
MKKINFYEIPDEGLSLYLDDPSWFPEDMEHQGVVSAEVHLKRLGERVVVAGKISATVVFECDRCLEKYDQELDSRFNIDLELLDEENVLAEERDHFFHDEEMDMDFLHDSEIDIVDILQQQVILALPMKKMCSEKCRGICPGCGANLNLNECECKTEKDSPFSILSKLKVK